MSEYQYYDFRAIDKPLDEKAMTALREITSRAEISSTSLINVYHYGSFRGDPESLMEKYFDAFVYVSNWGTRRFMLRLPRHLFNLEDARPYCVREILTVRNAREHVILDFNSQEEGGDWENGGDWMDSLIAVRANLMVGDLRSLYLGWLLGVENHEVDEDKVEPPVPAGLRSLSPPLKALANFLRVDRNLIEVAGRMSEDEQADPVSPEGLAAWVAALPDDTRNQALVRVMRGEASLLASELLRRYHQDHAKRPVRSGRSRPTIPVLRTAGQLLEARDGLEEERQREKEEEQARRDREETAARVVYLDSLVGKEESLWKQIETAISTKKPAEYDRAVKLLKDIHDLSERSGDTAAFEKRLRKLRTKHNNKTSLKQKLASAGLSR